MRKAKFFHLPDCKSCVIMETYLDSLNEEHYLIIEKFNMGENKDIPLEEAVRGRTEASYYGVSVPPTLIITEANDDDNIVYTFRGGLTQSGKENIFKHLVTEGGD